MASVNKVLLIGNLGKDPETRYMPNGDAVTNITLATTETWKDKNGEKQEKTEWHRVVIFNEGLARIAEQLKRLGEKGISKMIMITGDNQKVAEAIAKECWAANPAVAAMKERTGRRAVLRRVRLVVKPPPEAAAGLMIWMMIFRFEGYLRFHGKNISLKPLFLGAFLRFVNFNAVYATFLMVSATRY